VSPVYLSEEDNILPVPMDVAYAVSGFSKLLYNISGTDIELGPLVVDTPNSENEPETNLGAGMFEAADKLDDTPVFMVYGTEAFSRKGASKFYDLLKGEKDKLVIEGSGHFDLYWMPEYVEPAVEAVSSFLYGQIKI